MCSLSNKATSCVCQNIIFYEVLHSNDPPPSPPSDKGGSGGKDHNVTTVLATAGQGSDRPQEVSYTVAKIIGNGSFGVVYQAKWTDSGEMVAIKKVLQDKRFKVFVWFFLPFFLP